MTKTDDNLANAFAGESQANRKYTAFSRQAEKDGMKNIAKLFRGVAEAETVHALAHFKAMGGIKTTLEHLKEAHGGEDYEIESMYPPMVEEAEADGHKAAKRSFEFALAVEKLHRELYDEAIKAVENGEDLPDSDVYVCDICGHTVRGEAPDQCPTCKAKKEHFMKIE